MKANEIENLQTPQALWWLVGGTSALLWFAVAQFTDSHAAPWWIAGVWAFFLLYLIYNAEADEDEAEKLRKQEQEEQSGAFAGLDQINAAGFLSGRGIPFGWYDGRLLKYDGENHLVTVGTPGSGKFTTVIAPALLDYPASAFVIDPKGEAAAVCSRARRELGNKVFHLNPYGMFPETLGQAQFNPLAHLDPLSLDFVANVRSLAHCLIKDSSQGKDSHWADSARSLLACLMQYVCIAKGEVKTLPRVYELLSEAMPTLGEADGILAKMCAIQSIRNAALQFNRDSEEVESIISTAKTQTAWIDDPAIRACLNNTSKGLDFALMREQKITVFLVLPAKHLDSQSRWLRLVITAAIDALTSQPAKANDSRVLFALDEFAQLGYLAAIEKALGLVRGYGIQLWPFLQDLNQLKNLYPERWLSFIATAGVQQFLALNDDFTASHIIKQAGKHIKKRHSKSRVDLNDKQRAEGGTGLSYSEAETPEDLLTPQTLYQLPKSQQIVFTAGSKYTYKLNRFIYEDIEGLKQRADNNPYHLKKAG